MPNHFVVTLAAHHGVTVLPAWNYSCLWQKSEKDRRQASEDADAGAQDCPSSHIPPSPLSIFSLQKIGSQPLRYEFYSVK